MSQRKKTEAAVKPSWIPESRSFFDRVITDTLQYFRINSTHKLSQSEEKAICSLETKWRQNYKVSERMPEPSLPPTVAPLPKPAPRKQRRPAAKPKPKTTPDAEPVDLNSLNDNVKVVFRINIPPLRPHWQCRSFDLNVPAYVCKDNLIQPLITWQLLDRIMELPLEEATAAFQMHINKLLQLQ